MTWPQLQSLHTFQVYYTALWWHLSIAQLSLCFRIQTFLLVSEIRVSRSFSNTSITNLEFCIHVILSRFLNRAVEYYLKLSFETTLTTFVLTLPNYTKRFEMNLVLIVSCEVTKECRLVLKIPKIFI